MTTRRQFIEAGVAAGAIALVPGQRALTATRGAYASVTTPQTPLAGASVPKYVDPVTLLNGSRVSSTSFMAVMQEFQQRVLPASLPTRRLRAGARRPAHAAAGPPRSGRGPASPGW